MSVLAGQRDFVVAHEPENTGLMTHL